MLANAEEPPYEAVVVDNGSREPTRTYLEVLASLDDPPVGLVVPATNRSKGAAQVATSYTRYGEMVRFARRRRRELAGEPPRDIEVADMFCVALRRGVFEVIGALDDRLARARRALIEIFPARRRCSGSSRGDAELLRIRQIPVFDSHASGSCRARCDGDRVSAEAR